MKNVILLAYLARTSAKVNKQFLGLLAEPKTSPLGWIDDHISHVYLQGVKRTVKI